MSNLNNSNTNAGSGVGGPEAVKEMKSVDEDTDDENIGRVNVGQNVEQSKPIAAAMKKLVDDSEDEAAYSDDYADDQKQLDPELQPSEKLANQESAA